MVAARGFPYSSAPGADALRPRQFGMANYRAGGNQRRLLRALCPCDRQACGSPLVTRSFDESEQAQGATLTGQALAVPVEPASGLAPSGFDPSRVVLDACCGSRMFWFDRNQPDTIFVDNRSERHSLRDISSKGGERSLVIEPDLLADFTALPFPDGHFALVCFDPPHLITNGKSGWLAKKYGKLGADWREDLRKGFAECFRVLRPEGVLAFKWNEHEIPVTTILGLTPIKPLFGNRCGRTAKSHWFVFMKPAQGMSAGTVETHSGSGPQDRQPGPEGDAPNSDPSNPGPQQ